MVINGWKKVNEKDLWLKRKNGDSIALSIQRIPDAKGNIMYEVVLEFKSTLKLFKTKTAALKYARNYMRRN